MTKTINKAEYDPNLPMSSAIAASFIYSGVTKDIKNKSLPSSSSDLNKADILPTQDESPTTIISIFPSPVNTLVPDIIIGLGTS